MSDEKKKLGSMVEGTPYSMPVPCVMLVEVGEVLGLVSEAALPALHLRVTVVEARVRMVTARPLVVVAGERLYEEEIAALEDLARAVGAVVVRAGAKAASFEARVKEAWRRASHQRGG